MVEGVCLFHIDERHIHINCSYDTIYDEIDTLIIYVQHYFDLLLFACMQLLNKSFKILYQRFIREELNKTLKWPLIWIFIFEYEEIGVRNKLGSKMLTEIFYGCSQCWMNNNILYKINWNITKAWLKLIIRSWRSREFCWNTSNRKYVFKTTDP